MLFVVSNGENNYRKICIRTIAGAREFYLTRSSSGSIIFFFPTPKQHEPEAYLKSHATQAENVLLV